MSTRYPLPVHGVGRRQITLQDAEHSVLIDVPLEWCVIYVNVFHIVTISGVVVNIFGFAVTKNQLVIKGTVPVAAAIYIANVKLKQGSF